MRELVPEVVDQLSIEFLDDDVMSTVFASGRSITKPACRVEVRAEDQEPLEVVLGCHRQSLVCR